MGKILCFVPERFAEFEVTLALHLLRDMGQREIVTVGYTRDPVVSYSGLCCVPDITLEGASKLHDIEAFIMPGGPIAEHSEPLTALLQSLHAQNILLAAICFGPQYMARAGLLAACHYTTSCSPGHIQKLGIADPFPRENYREERVVTDGSIITAQGHAFVDFAYAIVRRLGIAESENDLTWLYNAITNR
ncbi:MAG TPA: DJ-1/PfpI family protein [Candidatus Limiplasma sp.]|nr:DJ-1/PfpI family protein [Candidatus Limiplasma sp.]